MRWSASRPPSAGVMRTGGGKWAAGCLCTLPPDIARALSRRGPTSKHGLVGGRETPPLCPAHARSPEVDRLGPLGVLDLTDLHRCGAAPGRWKDGDPADPEGGTTTARTAERWARSSGLDFVGMDPWRVRRGWAVPLRGGVKGDGEDPGVGGEEDRKFLHRISNSP